MMVVPGDKRDPERAPCRAELEEFNLAIVGLARNCEKTIRADIRRLHSAARKAKSIVWLIVESDSSDKTVSELERLQAELDDFQFISFGDLAKTIPKRTERMSRCRNCYAEHIRTGDRFSGIDYVVVADLDGVNNNITQDALESCWKRSDWDMCAANQDGPYYDIWALRHQEWGAEDCWAQYKFLNRYRSAPEKNAWASVYSKMITIPRDSEWIEVESAFGGLAVYKKSAFVRSHYVGKTEAGDEICEHVEFHRQLKSRGAKLYINPQLVNATITEHTAHLLYKNRVRKRISSGVRELLIRAIGLKKLRHIKSLVTGRHV